MDTWIHGDLDTGRLGDLCHNCVIITSKLLHYYVIIASYLDTSLDGYFYTWILGYLDTLVHFDTLIFGYLDTRVLGHLDTSILG